MRRGRCPHVPQVPIVPDCVTWRYGDNNVGDGSSWPFVKFCPLPCSSNRDGRVTPIKVGPSSKCDTSVACATFATTTNHITSSTVWIGEPPAIPQWQQYF